MERNELEERIASFPRWHYEFEFDNGVTTPIWDRTRIIRHKRRRGYFFDALLSVTGGSLRGHRVLDLGCNAGFWSLNALEAGADFLLGVDGRQMHVDQANLVCEARGIDPARYRFEQANIFDYDFEERFDVVLCLGLMYHIAKPVELFELMTRLGAEIIVIDTQIFPAPMSFFKVHYESIERPMNAVDYELVMLPTRQAVIDLAGLFGFKTVPLALNLSDYTGMGDYHKRRRLAFVCSKSVSLDALPRETRFPLKREVAQSMARTAIGNRLRKRQRGFVPHVVSEPRG